MNGTGTEHGKQDQNRRKFLEQYVSKNCTCTGIDKSKSPNQGFYFIRLFIWVN